jgi:Ca2+-binding EF-hand superfamily protein
VFDDNVPVGQEMTKTMEGKYRLNDLIGTCSASLAPLMHDRPIVTRLHIRDFEEKIKGSLLVRIYWDDCNLDGGALFNNLDRTWEDSISVRICKAFKDKGLSVKMAFKLTDLDDSKEIDKDEFYKIVCDILKIGLTPEEKHEYWQRVSSRNILTFNRFLKYYAPFLNKEMLGFEIPENPQLGPNGLPLPNNGGDLGIGSASIDKIDARLAMIIDKLSKGLKQYQSDKKKSLLEMFSLFDKDHSKKISRIEFIDSIEQVFEITWIPVRDLEYIFDYLNKNDSDAELDLNEFFKIMKFDLEKFAEEKQQRELEKRSASELLDKNQILFEFIDAVKKWLKQHDKSVYDLFLKIDKDGSKKVSRVELKKSCYELFDLKNFNDKKMEVVMMELDEDENKTVDVQEFIDLMNLYEEFKLLSNKQNLKEIRESPILRHIYSYINLKEIEPEDLMLEIDKNKDGSI